MTHRIFFPGTQEDWLQSSWELLVRYDALHNVCCQWEPWQRLSWQIRTHGASSPVWNQSLCSWGPEHLAENDALCIIYCQRKADESPICLMKSLLHFSFDKTVFPLGKIWVVWMLTQKVRPGVYLTEVTAAKWIHMYVTICAEREWSLHLLDPHFPVFLFDHKDIFKVIRTCLNA